MNPSIPPFVSLFFDIAFLAALGAAIFYGLRLSGQINRMRADRREFETLIHNLDAAAARAGAVIRSLKEDVIGGSEALQDKLNKSRAMCEELEIMIQAGDSLATRLQSLAEKARPGPAEADSAPGAAAQEFAPRTRAEKDLLEAIRAKQQA